MIYKLTAGLDAEELTEIEQIQLKSEGLLNGDDFEKGEAYINLGLNHIKSLEPRCFVPKGKQYKKYFTEVVFDDGTAVNADYKSGKLYAILNDYYKNIPELDKPE